MVRFRVRSIDDHGSVIAGPGAEGPEAAAFGAIDGDAADEMDGCIGEDQVAAKQPVITDMCMANGTKTTNVLKAAAGHSTGNTLINLNLAFADGHSEVHKWKDPRTSPVLKRGGELNLNVISANNQDVFWLMERSTRKP